MLEGEDKLIQEAQKGNAASFGRIYDYYLPKIYRYVVLKVRNKHEAEDICHDVFLSAWQNIANYAHQGHPFSSWLYQIARNRVIDHYRTKKSHYSIEDVKKSFIQEVSSIESEVDDFLSIERVYNAMHELSGEQQDVLIMRFIEDLSHREIGAALNKSEGAVRLIQYRALNTLKEILEKQRNNDE